MWALFRAFFALLIEREKFKFRVGGQKYEKIHICFIYVGSRGSGYDIV